MNKRVYFLAAAFLLLFIAPTLKAEEPSVKTIRKLLVVAIDNSKTTDSLYKILVKIKEPTPLMNGYIAALQSVKAKHAWNPYFKVKYLKDSEKTFKKAVAADPHNMEIRFMRFSIEHNVPGILGFNKDLKTDSEDIIAQLEKKNYGTADKELTIAIIKFLLHSKRCTPEQNTVLNKHLAELS